MIAIDVINLSKRFRFPRLPKQTTLKEAVVKQLWRSEGANVAVEALKDVSFSLERGKMLGIVGTNGSGKTTLLRVLAGAYRPDGGSYTMAGTVTPLLALGAGFHPELTGRENARVELLVLGLSPKEINAQMDRIHEFSELGDFFDAPLRMYSTGMGMRLAFASAISVNPDILLLDEVLAVGDEAFAQKCLRRIDELRNGGATIVLVTHQADTVRDRCDLALWLSDGRVAAFGAPGEIFDAYHAHNVERNSR